MLKSTRDTAATGHRGCRCCYPVPDASTLRQREKQAWMHDQVHETDIEDED